MQENKNRKQEFESAIKEYLSRAVMYPRSYSWELAQTGNYVFVFGMSSFSNQDDPETYYFLVPQDAERMLMDEVDSLFDSQLSAATVRGSLQRAINEIHENTKFIFPFETDYQEEQYHDRIYELLKSHYDSRYDAIVPMFQLECADGVEFPLANAVLYSGGERPSLADLVNDNANGVFDSDKSRIANCSFLKFPVTGDSHSRLEQVENEVEQALRGLRFIFPWFENNNKTYNPAHGVSMWKHSNRTILFDRSSEASNFSPWYSEIPNGILGTRRISAELLNDAQEFYGLDDINYHFQNFDCNSVSKRICRALSFYDAASKTPDIQFAFSNFIISIDILLPPQNVPATVLTGHLKSLIGHAKYYVGKMNLNEELDDPKSTSWPERVDLTTVDFKDFYTTRGQILHGNKEERYKTKISKLQVKKARQIAHNAIRAYAYLARGFQWENDKEAKNWFKSPCKPPKEITDSASKSGNPS